MTALSTATLILMIPRFAVTEAGRYDVLVLANDREIGRQIITITRYERESGDAEDEGEAG